MEPLLLANLEKSNDVNSGMVPYRTWMREPFKDKEDREVDKDVCNLDRIDVKVDDVHENVIVDL